MRASQTQCTRFVDFAISSHTHETQTRAISYFAVVLFVYSAPLIQTLSAGEKLIDTLVDRFGRVLEVLLLVLLAELYAFVLHVQRPDNKIERVDRSEIRGWGLGLGWGAVSENELDGVSVGGRGRVLPISPSRRISSGSVRVDMAHAPGSSNVSCYRCNESVGLIDTRQALIYVEVWELKLYFYPSAGLK